MLIVSEHYWPAQQLQLPSSFSSSTASDNDPLATSNMMMDTDSNNDNSSKGLKHASSIQQQLDEYNNAYHNLKKPRKLYPLPQHGAVEVELTFDDHVQTQRSFLCRPILADVIMLLQTDDSQTASAVEGGGATGSSIATQLHITEEEATAALLFWKTRHVLIAHPTVVGCYIVDEEQARWAAEDQAPTRRKVSAAMDDKQTADEEEDEDDSNMLELSFSFEESPNNNHSHTHNNNAANTEQKRKASIQYATSFITGLLRSHGGMPIDRLQPLLAVTLRAALEADPEGLTSSSDLSFAWSKGALMQFMQQYLVNEGIIDCMSGVYSMPSSSSRK